LNVCSTKGLAEMFDSTIGASSVLMPFGGKHQLTPAIVMASKPPVSGFTDTATVSSFGCNPNLNQSSPFIGSIYSIVVSMSKLVASGVDPDTIRLTLQEFFKRLNKDENRWGEPLSALLGALYAEINLQVAAIGGKDSMSGSFMDIDVPPTLISFGMGIAKASELITNAFLKTGRLVWLPIKRDKFNVPDFEYLKKLYSKVYEGIKAKKIVHASVVEEGGVAVEAVKCAMGEGFGISFAGKDK
jgi:phosphoribosylformylglycinamidine synthase